jgi:prolyl-tRNA synthetase
VSAFTDLPESSQMKSLVLVAGGRPLLVMLRGDHQLSETKFGAVAGDAAFRPAHPAEIREAFGADPGSLGPVGVTRLRILADDALRGRRNMIAGANKDDHHLRHVTRRGLSGGVHGLAPGGGGRRVHALRRAARDPQGPGDRAYLQAGV